MLEVVLLAVMIVLEVAIPWALVGPSSAAKPVIESINVPAKIVRGTLPGGSYESWGEPCRASRSCRAACWSST